MALLLWTYYRQLHKVGVAFQSGESCVYCSDGELKAIAGMPYGLYHMISSLLQALHILRVNTTKIGNCD